MTDLNRDIIVFIGTYTRREAHVLGKAEGIYTYRLDPSSGALSYAGVATGIDNPTFLALDPRQRTLYAANEIADFGGKAEGAISAFAIDHESGALTLLNQQSSQNAGPCHLSVDQTGHYVVAANYAGGSVTMLPIKADGSLGEASDHVQHEGSSINPNRQEGPHAHSINPDPANRFAYAPDLGLDKVMIYRLDLTNGKLVANDQPWAQVTAGAGPRHFDFHPSGNFAYVINELDSTITGFHYDEADGGLTAIETVPTLPAEFSGSSSCADIHVLPSGKFLYGSNRGHDSIVIFAIDEETGRLSLVGHESTQGATPRNFAIDPTATFLLAANQNSNNVVVFRIDQDSGQLTPTGHVAQVPTPVCIKMIDPN